MIFLFLSLLQPAFSFKLLPTLIADLMIDLTVSLILVVYIASYAF